MGRKMLVLLAPIERPFPPMTFKVGETVVYPHHGAAQIEAIEKRTIKGEEKIYLVLSTNLTRALGISAPKRFPAPAAAIIAAVLLIMTV